MSQSDEDEIKTIPRSVASEEASLSAKVGKTDTGTEEAKLLSRGLSERDIKKEAAEHDHDRQERFRDHFERIAIGAMYFLAIVFLLVGATWLFHLLGPPSWQYHLG